MYLFIDSNIWLSLYDLSKDDLKQFTTLTSHCRDGQINLIIPSQVRDEVLRNRDAKLKKSLDGFSIININFPNVAKASDEYDSFKRDYDILRNRQIEWINNLKKSIDEEKTQVDRVIKTLLRKSNIKTVPTAIVDKAVLRYKIGNPPGKNNSYGDAINWEFLLSVVPDGESIHFVSDDKDYRSPLSDEKMNSFLVNEWKQTKKSDIYFYRSLTDFFKNNIASIEQRSKMYRMNLIDKIGSCEDFDELKQILFDLRSRYVEWPDDVIEKMCIYLSKNSVADNLSEDIGALFEFGEIVKEYAGFDQTTKLLIDKLIR